jgi:hypothetical protein
MLKDCKYRLFIYIWLNIYVQLWILSGGAYLLSVLRQTPIRGHKLHIAYSCSHPSPAQRIRIDKMYVAELCASGSVDSAKLRNHKTHTMAQLGRLLDLQKILH